MKESIMKEREWWNLGRPLPLGLIILYFGWFAGNFENLWTQLFMKIILKRDCIDTSIKDIFKSRVENIDNR